MAGAGARGRRNGRRSDRGGDQQAGYRVCVRHGKIKNKTRLVTSLYLLEVMHD